MGEPDDRLRRAAEFQSSLGPSGFSAWRAQRFEDETLQYLWARYHVPARARYEFLRWVRKQDKGVATLAGWSTYFGAYPCFLLGRTSSNIGRSLTISRLFGGFERLPLARDFSHLRQVYLGSDDPRPLGCVIPWGHLGSGRALVLHNARLDRGQQPAPRLLGWTPEGDKVVLETLRTFLDALDQTYDAANSAEDWFAV